MELASTGPALRSVTVELTAARARLDALPVVMTSGEGWMNLNDEESVKWQPEARCFDLLADAIAAVSRAAWVHGLGASGDRTSSPELTSALVLIEALVEKVSAMSRARRE